MNKIYKTVRNKKTGVWEAVSELAKSGKGRAGTMVIAASLGFVPLTVWADTTPCNGHEGTNGQGITVTGNTSGCMIGSGMLTPTNTPSVTVDNNVTITNDNTAISVTGGTTGSPVTINIGSGAHVTTNSGDQYGPSGIGPNVIETTGHTILNIEQGAVVEQAGNATHGEVFNPEAGGNTVNNHGTMQTWQPGNAVIWFEDDDPEPNTINNYGVMQAGYSGSLDGTGVVTGASGSSNVIHFVNWGDDPANTSGQHGKVYGNLELGDGGNTVTLQKGSEFKGEIFTGNGDDTVTIATGAVFSNPWKVNGSTINDPNAVDIDGGEGQNTLILNGSDADRLSDAGKVVNFDKLIKDGSGEWAIDYDLVYLDERPNATGPDVEVKQGKLILTDNNTLYNAFAPTANVLIDGGGTLQLGDGGTSGGLGRDITNNGTLAFNRSDNGLTLDAAISGTGQVEQNGTGTTTLQGIAKTYTGHTTVNHGTLKAGADDIFSSVSDYFVQPGGTLQLDGYHQTIQSLNNSGTVDLHKLDNTRADTVLAVSGDYQGYGGRLVVNSIWNNNNSTSDLLSIAGNASGTTFVSTPDGIIGDVTRGTAQIFSADVVTIAGTDAGNATFVGTAETTNAGEAQLVKKDAHTYAWTLYAQNTGTPIYADSIPAYVSMPRVNMEQTYAGIGTLHERRGENQTLAWDGGDSAKGQTWGRIYGKKVKQDGKDRIDLDTDIYGIQIGHDFLIRHNENGSRNITGAYLSYSKADTDFADEDHAENGLVTGHKHTGKGKSDAISAGLTNTYYTGNGSYLDLVGQISYLHNKYESRSGVDPDSQDGWGAALSAEVGRPFALTGHSSTPQGWLIEPQAQLIYQYVKLDNFHDRIRKADQNNQDGLRGRLGVRIARNGAVQNHSQTNTFYAVANVWHDFLNPGDVDIGRDSLREKYAATWGEVGLGIQMPVARNSYIYGDARYEHDFGSTKREGYKGSIGFRYTWQ